MDNNYKQAPGLWNGIYFLEGSKENRISSAVIENSETGLRLGTPDNDTVPDLIIESSIIRHSSLFGIQAYNSDIQSTNLLIYDIGLIPAFHAIGGSYYYEHCTISNFPSQLGSQEPSIILSDHLITESETLQDELKLEIKNSIFWTGGADSDLQVSTINSTNSINLTNNNLQGTIPPELPVKRVKCESYTGRDRDVKWKFLAQVRYSDDNDTERFIGVQDLDISYRDRYCYKALKTRVGDLICSISGVSGSGRTEYLPYNLKNAYPVVDYKEGRSDVDDCFHYIDRLRKYKLLDLSNQKKLQNLFPLKQPKRRHRKKRSHCQRLI